MFWGLGSGVSMPSVRQAARPLGEPASRVSSARGDVADSYFNVEICPKDKITHV